jgi:type IV pilus secretin PilQ/predicted competence protein
MAKLHPTLCVLAALSVSSAFAQDTAQPKSAAPATPAKGATPAAVPAPIEPPIQVPAGQQAIPPAVGDANATALPPGTLPPAAPAGSGSTNGTRTIEFQGDEIGLVLRTLARQAKMNIVVSDSVATTAGTVTMRIEDKTPRDAIDTIVTAKGLILDEQKGVYFIKTAAEKAKEPTESGSYTLSYANAEKVAPLLQGQLQSAVAPQVDQRTNTLFYRENRSNLDKIKLFLETIDRPTQQVMIEARLVEVTANPRQSYGINWAGVVGSSGAPQTIKYGGSTPATNKIQTDTDPITGATTTKVVPDQLQRILTNNGKLDGQDFLFNGLTRGGFGDALGGQFAILSAPAMSITLRLLNEDADAEFLAHPRIVTANNTKATIKITRAQPVPQLNFNEQTAQAVFSGFQDKEFGNTLVVTPSINKDNFISLVVQPEISNKVGDATFAFGGATVTSPVIDKRTLDSNVLIKSGDTLAIGGLLQDEQTKGRTKVPVIGDIPVLGYLFQEKLAARTKRNLLVFVTPTVIKQGYGTGLEGQVSGLSHTGEEFADPNSWRNNAKGAKRLVPTPNRQLAADYPKPGVAPAPKRTGPQTDPDFEDPGAAMPAAKKAPRVTPR